MVQNHFGSSDSIFEKSCHCLQIWFYVIVALKAFDLLMRSLVSGILFEREDFNPFINSLEI